MLLLHKWLCVIQTVYFYGKQFWQVLIKKKKELIFISASDGNGKNTFLCLMEFGEYRLQISCTENILCEKTFCVILMNNFCKYVRYVE